MVLDFSKQRIDVIFFILIAFAIVLFYLGGNAPGGDVPEEYPIYDIHEHLAEGNIGTLLYAMRENNISYTAVVASPRYTLTLRGPGFDNYIKNNNYLLGASKTNPILVFCTIDPRDEDALDILKGCVEDGASGLKLYNGHYSSYYKFLGPLDREEMLPIYEYCEENNIPILYHVNPYYLQEEFENVLGSYPNLRVDCPHWCLSSINDTRFRELYDTYPNLYTDISFGSMFAQDGFERFSEDPEKFRDLVERYQDRIMFGADMVITDLKNSKFAKDMMACYRKMLEEEQYSCSVGTRGSKFSVYGNFTGLKLPPDILRKIYYENPTRFLGLLNN